MFVAKFTPTSSAPFTSDKNGNYPFIGTVVAGKAKGSIINGTMFKREGLEVNKLYLCDNSVNPEYPDNHQTDVIASVTISEFMQLRTELGAPSNVVATAESVEAVQVSAEA